MPLLVAAPAELTAASVVTGLVQGICQVAGPALGGLVIVLAGAPAALLVAAGCFAIAVAADLGLPSSAGLAQRPTHGERPGVRAGARVALGDRRLRLVLGLFAAKNLGRGALNVLIVLIPLALLGLGSAGVGWLTAAVGIGGVIGGAAATALVTRRRLSIAMAGGIALWGLAFLAIGILDDLPTAIVALVVLGIGNAICDASGYSLVPRSARDDVLSRVYGIHESVRAAAIAGGALTALVAVYAGTRDALLAAGAVLVATAAAGLLLRRHDASEAIDPHKLELLRGIPCSGGCRRCTRATRVEARADQVATGHVLMREGDSATART